MKEAIGSAVASAVERVAAAAHIGTLAPAASLAPSSSSSSTPTSCDMIGRTHVKARWLIRMLAWVRATLDDAEDMNTTDASILNWLRELQEVADAAEDLLDEFPPEALRLGFVEDGGWSTAGSITELPRQGMMASETDRLHDQGRLESVQTHVKKNKLGLGAEVIKQRKTYVPADKMKQIKCKASNRAHLYCKMKIFCRWYPVLVSILVFSLLVSVPFECETFDLDDEGSSTADRRRPLDGISRRRRTPPVHALRHLPTRALHGGVSARARRRVPLFLQFAVGRYQLQSLDEAPLL